MNGNSNAYKWAATYHVMTAGESNVLVLHPKKEGILHISVMRLEDLQKPTYAERLYIDLWKIHQDALCSFHLMLSIAPRWTEEILLVLLF